MPMTMSRTTSPAVKCFSTCGVVGIGYGKWAGALNDGVLDIVMVNGGSGTTGVPSHQT
jgi:hypothetical protein